MLELMIGNSKDAQDHLHARTCQREANKGRARSLGKTLNRHEDHRYANTRRLCIYNMMKSDNDLITMNEGAQIYGAQ